MADEVGLFDVMYSCRAMRRLDSRPVPEDLLIKLIDAANQAPSGSNQQRARWIIVRDAGQREQLAALNKKAVEAYIGPQSGRAGNCLINRLKSASGCSTQSSGRRSICRKYRRW